MTFSEEQIEELAKVCYGAAWKCDGLACWQHLTDGLKTHHLRSARAVAERAVEMAEKGRVQA